MLRGHESGVRSAVFFPDSAIIFTASCDSFVKLWLVDTKECMKTLRAPKAFVKLVVFSPQGSSTTMAPHGKKRKPALVAGEQVLWVARAGDKVHTLERTGRVRDGTGLFLQATPQAGRAEAAERANRGPRLHLETSTRRCSPSGKVLPGGPIRPL